METDDEDTICRTMGRRCGGLLTGRTGWRGVGLGLVQVGMLEIYNEELKDLLAPPEQRLHAGIGRLQVNNRAPHAH
eukprot:4597701-Pyramimonas_sp.AAC.2